MTANPASILDSVKQTLGITYNDPSFDIDVVMHINSAFAVLRQLGAGSSSGFVITDNTLLWTDFTPDIVQLALVKSYVVSKVKFIFDPPQNARLMDAIERQIVEFEERIMMIAEEINPPSDPTATNDNDDDSALIEELEQQFFNDFGDPVE
jgi:hypothetical protein